MLNLGCVSSAMFDTRLPRRAAPDAQSVACHHHVANDGECADALYRRAKQPAGCGHHPAPLPSLPDDLQSRPFTSEKTVLALSSQHPLAKSSALTLASVKDEKMDLLRDPEGMGLEQYFYDVCYVAGFQPEVVQNATDVPTVISLVSAGFGMALLPASARAVSVENVVYVDIIDRLRESELKLVCHRIIRSEVLKKFLHTLDHI